MTSDQPRPSAKIYAFPPRRLSISGGKSDQFGSKHADPAPGPVVDCSGSWYHAAALRDADGARRS